MKKETNKTLIIISIIKNKRKKIYLMEKRKIKEQILVVITKKIKNLLFLFLIVCLYIIV